MQSLLFLLLNFEKPDPLEIAELQSQADVIGEDVKTAARIKIVRLSGFAVIWTPDHWQERSSTMEACWGYTLNVGYALPVMCRCRMPPLAFCLSTPGGYINFRLKVANVYRLFVF
jgi:hypothetical protein